MIIIESIGRESTNWEGKLLSLLRAVSLIIFLVCIQVLIVRRMWPLLLPVGSWLVTFHLAVNKRIKEL